MHQKKPCTTCTTVRCRHGWSYSRFSWWCFYATIYLCVHVHFQFLLQINVYTLVGVARLWLFYDIDIIHWMKGVVQLHERMWQRFVSWFVCCWLQAVIVFFGLFVNNITWWQHGMNSVQLHPPELFNFKNPDDWPRWKRRFEQYCSAMGLAAEDDSRQVNTWLYCMGEEENDVLTSSGIFSDARQKYNFVKSKFDKFFKVHWNTIFKWAKA